MRSGRGPVQVLMNTGVHGHRWWSCRPEGWHAPVSPGHNTSPARPPRRHCAAVWGSRPHTHPPDHPLTERAACSCHKSHMPLHLCRSCHVGGAALTWPTHHPPARPPMLHTIQATCLAPSWRPSCRRSRPRPPRSPPCGATWPGAGSAAGAAVACPARAPPPRGCEQRSGRHMLICAAGRGAAGCARDRAASFWHTAPTTPLAHVPVAGNLPRL